MKDSEVFTILIAVLTPHFKKHFPDAIIAQAAQQRAQGTTTVPGVYMRNVHDHRPGSARTTYGFKPVPGENVPDGFMPAKTTQWIESRIQFTGMLSTPVPTAGQPTAGDMIRCIALLLSTDVILQSLRARGLNPMRVTDIQKPLFSDDRNQFATYPTTDLVVQHIDTLDLDVPQVAIVTPEVHAV